MNWLKYLLEANLYLIAFYALYYIIFRKETWYQLNRIYLLLCTVLAFIIPVIQLGILSPPDNQLQDVVVTIDLSAPARHSWILSDYVLAVYGLVVLVLLTNLIIKVFRLIRLSGTNRIETHARYKLIELPEENNAFSFFNYLFISKQLMGSPTVIRHELIHIRQKHSWDILYLEVLKAFNWFNPVVWLMQNSMKEVHEFMADSQSVNAEVSAETYTDFLVDSAYGINHNILTNTFFNKNLLKKRIMMLHRKRSGNAARLKYLLIAPLTGGMLCASTLAFAKTYGWIDLAPRYASHALNETAKANKMRLKVTMGGNSFITDKIAFRNTRGEGKVYTVNSFTDRDKAFLLASQNVKIELVEAGNDLADTVKKRKTIKRDTKYKVDSVKGEIRTKIKYEIDSARKSNSDMPPPPPPPVPPVKTGAVIVIDKRKVPPPPPPAPPKLIRDTLSGNMIPPPRVIPDKAKTPPPVPPKKTQDTL